jgi:hypothetical protein
MIAATGRHLYQEKSDEIMPRFRERVLAELLVAYLDQLPEQYDRFPGGLWTTMATALLRLRGSVKDEDGRLVEKLMAASVLDEKQHAEVRPGDEGLTPPRAD